MPPDSEFPAPVTPTIRTTRDLGRVTWTVANGLRPTRVTFDRDEGRCTFSFHTSPKLAELWAAFDRNEARGAFRDFADADRIVRAIMARARRDGVA